MKTLQELLDRRFGDIGAVPETLAGNEAIAASQVAVSSAASSPSRCLRPCSIRWLPWRYHPRRRATCSSGTFSSSRTPRSAPASISSSLKDQDWIPGCPHLLVFLGNNRRQRQVHAWRGHTFANDHLDAFFNATVDAAIALEAFVAAAEAAGLGCCPISVIRNHAEEVSELLGLPYHVFPVAGLGVGAPATPAFVSTRLPLGLTVHRDRYTDATDGRCAPTTSGAMTSSPTALNAMSTASARRKSTAGVRTRPVTMPCRSARISAPM